MGTVAIQLNNAVKVYGRNVVLAGLELDVERGEFLAVLGPSGSGKSTLLRVLAGLEPLDGGELRWPDSPGTSPPIVATVFQQPLLMPWLTVRENVALGGRYRANRTRFDHEHVDELLALFGLADLADALPEELSGGQAQRVAVARAVAIRPQVLLLDEPFSALDPVTRRGLQAWLRDATRSLGLTVVLVTHDVDEALYLATRIALLDGSGTVAGWWRAVPVDDHEDLVGHPLRAELLASYPSELGTATRGAS